MKGGLKIKKRFASANLFLVASSFLKPLMTKFICVPVLNLGLLLLTPTMFCFLFSKRNVKCWYSFCRKHLH